MWPQDCDYVLKFPDGTYYTGFASTLVEARAARTSNIQQALTYTEKRAYAIRDASPGLQVIHKDQASGPSR